MQRADLSEGFAGEIGAACAVCDEGAKARDDFDACATSRVEL
jgi:hypothetical protein